jgi:hypothetical protein
MKLQLEPIYLFDEELEPPRMGRPSVSAEEYVNAGLAKGLLFIGEEGSFDFETKEWRVGRRPKNIKTATVWFCPNCTRGKIRKSKFAITQSPNKGCRCQNDQSLTRAQYHEVAKKVGIMWAPEHDLIPANVRTVTRWIGIDGQEFYASKFDLFNFGQLPRKDLRDSIAWEMLT